MLRFRVLFFGGYSLGCRVFGFYDQCNQLPVETLSEMTLCVEWDVKLGHLR